MHILTNNVLRTGFSILSFLFGILFVVIGVLNLFLVHAVPGIFYLLLSCLYLFPTATSFKNRFGTLVPLAVKIFLGFIVLWGTLAVGDLAEILGL